MTIEHVALWTERLEEMRDFYVRCFGGTAGPRYCNPAKAFSSYFVRFGSGARVELMQRIGIGARPQGDASIGYAHLAFSVGSEEEVRRTTERLRDGGVAILGEPRRTGDGYYESVVADPDGNRIELTV